MKSTNDMRNLRRIIREMLTCEADIAREWDPKRQTRWSDQGPVPRDKPVSDEENWVTKVGSGDARRWDKTTPYSYTKGEPSGPMQDFIDDTEEYLDDVEYEAPGTTGAYMYGAEPDEYDPMCDVDDDECELDEFPVDEQW